MKQIVLLAFLLTLSITAKDLAFAADDFHISFGATLQYHTAYDAPLSNQTAGGFTFALDKAFAHTGAFSVGGDLQTVWYSQYAGETSFSITPRARFGFHPFGLSVLEGEVPLAQFLDPYIMMKVGFQFDNRFDPAIKPSFSPVTVGVRWYFADSFALWTELDSWYALSVGIGFWF